MESIRKKLRRIKIEETKEVLKKYEELLKQEFNIVVPKNIMNMDYLNLRVFVRNTLETIVEKGWDSDEISKVVIKLDICMKAFRYYRFNKIKSNEQEIL